MDKYFQLNFWSNFRSSSAFLLTL